MADVLLKATPLLFCGLAFLIAWKAGILNVGADGQFLVGALAASAVATRVPAAGPVLLALSLLAGVCAGAAWAGAAAWLSERRGVIDVLATLLLNFVAVGLVATAVHSFLQERARTFPQTDAVPAGASLPMLLPGTRVHLGVAAAAALALAFRWFLRATNAGFRMRAVGANREAAALAGIRVARIRLAAFLASGAVAGLGGAVELTGVTGRLYESFSSGYGFLGLAAAVIGRLDPVGTAAACAAFGALQSAGMLLERRFGVSSVAVLVLEALLLAAALALPRWRRARA